ncbi:MAG: hypothetical protein ABIP75_12935 [Pyrinomonadaceae bacterium]
MSFLFPEMDDDARAQAEAQAQVHDSASAPDEAKSDTLDRAEQPAPTTEQWARLYGLAVQVRELAPWRWMDETQVFAVEHPLTKELGFVSTMGQLGQHLSIAVYLGPKALYDFWGLQDGDGDPMEIFNVPHLQASLDDREALEKQDRQIIKELGLKFRGRQQYPLFRSIHAGYLPWFVHSDEAEFLIYALEQVLEVAPRVAKDPDILTAENDPSSQIYLVRMAELNDGRLQWHDDMRLIPEPPPVIPLVSPLEARASEFKSVPRIPGSVVQIDMPYLPTPIVEKGKRPYFPKGLLVADGETGFILGFELFSPSETAAELDLAVSAGIGKIFLTNNALPAEIQVGTVELFRLLRGWSQKLNIKLRQSDDLPAINQVKESMFSVFDR